jgi:hypothetical protein
MYFKEFKQIFEVEQVVFFLRIGTRGKACREMLRLRYKKKNAVLLYGLKRIPLVPET